MKLHRRVFFLRIKDATREPGFIFTVRKVSETTLLRSPDLFFARFVHVARYASRDIITKISNKSRSSRPRWPIQIPLSSTLSPWISFHRCALLETHRAKFILRLVKLYCFDNEIKVFRTNAPVLYVDAANHLNFSRGRKIACVSAPMKPVA